MQLVGQRLGPVASAKGLEQRRSQCRHVHDRWPTHQHRPPHRYRQHHRTWHRQRRSLRVRTVMRWRLQPDRPAAHRRQRHERHWIVVGQHRPAAHVRFPVVRRLKILRRRCERFAQREVQTRYMKRVGTRRGPQEAVYEDGAAHHASHPHTSADRAGDVASNRCRFLAELHAFGNQRVAHQFGLRLLLCPLQTGFRLLAEGCKRKHDTADHAQRGVDVLAAIEHETDVGMRQEHRRRTGCDQYRMNIDPTTGSRCLTAGSATPPPHSAAATQRGDLLAELVAPTIKCTDLRHHPFDDGP